MKKKIEIFLISRYERKMKIFLEIQIDEILEQNKIQTLVYYREFLKLSRRETTLSEKERTFSPKKR